MIFHLWEQMVQGRKPRLFKWGDQVRDFIYVDDVVKANLCALKAPSGIYNVGTGEGTTFNQLVSYLNEALGTQLETEYFDMPFNASSYQSHTLADTAKAEKELKFKARWKTRAAVLDYVTYLNNQKG
jgi:ADP-L-glycero-D-manno-heptose 6-epimerase